MKSVRTIEDLANLTAQEAKEYLEDYILIFITDEILLSCLKDQDSYIFRELNMAYDKATRRCVSCDCQYSTIYSTPEQAKDELVHRSNFLKSFISMNRPKARLLCHISHFANSAKTSQNI